jgi:hypothetical protein
MQNLSVIFRQDLAFSFARRQGASRAGFFGPNRAHTLREQFNPWEMGYSYVHISV